MESLPTLIIDLTIILALAAVTTLLCKKLRLPSVLGYILAGFLAGGTAVTFFPTVQGVANLETLSEIGVIFLMFGLGLEFSVHKMAEVGVPGILSASIQALGVGVLGFFLGEALHWGLMDSVFLGVMLAMSSTMITMKSIEDMGLKERRFAGLAMGTLVIEDILAIFAMVVLSTIAVSKSISGAALMGRIGLLIFYLVLWLILGIYLVPTWMKKLVRLMNDEVLLIFSLALCFVMALLAARIGLSVELGAFLAGSLLAGTIHAERVEHLVTPVKNLFGAIFFVSVGFMVQPAMIWKYLWVILLISIVAIIGKLVFLTLGSLAAGQPLDVSVQSAASQTQVGEFSFILAGLGVTLGVTSNFLYPVIVAVSVLTTFTTPVVLKASLPLCGFLEKVLPGKWLAAIDRHSRTREKDSGVGRGNWAKFLRSYFFHFILYGILATGVIMIGVRFLIPNMMKDWGPDHTMTVKIIACAILYAALILLISAMLRVHKRYFTALWLKGWSNRVVLLTLLTIRFAAAVALLVVPDYLIFHIRPLYLILVAIPIVILAARSRWLAGGYLEFEARFLANLNERQLEEWVEKELSEGRRHHWMTEQLMSIKVVCGPDYQNRGKTLRELNWGDLLHIKVIKLLHGQTCHIIPEGRIRVDAGDRMVITGSRQQLENFLDIMEERGVRQMEGTQMQPLKEFIESQEDLPDERQVLLFGMYLRKEMPQVGKSIRTSGIKTDWHAFLVGLERNNLPIMDPHPDMLLRNEDLLWLLGDQNMAAALAAEGLLDL